jgi:transcriptional regulator with XRE-family HTH domain
MGKPLARPKIEYPDLATYFAKSGDSQANTARVLRVPQAHLSRIAAGLIVPRPELAQRLASYARIPLDSFITTYLRRRGAEGAA